MQKEGKSVNSNLGSNVRASQRSTGLGPDGQTSVEGQREVNTQGSLGIFDGLDGWDGWDGLTVTKSVL